MRFYNELNRISAYPKNHSMSIYVIYMDGQDHKCTIKPQRKASSNYLK